MLQGYRNLLRGISTHWVGKLGVAITTSSFALLLVFEGLSIAGVLRNAYVGLLTYLTLPAFFILGLLLIPVGWWLHLRQTGKTSIEVLRERFEPGDVRGRFFGSRLFGITLLLTLLNLAFLGGASSRMVQFMDQPSFCGTACHVMAPEWAAYRASPHARVDCVACHVGEGVGALVESKLSGLRQTFHLAMNSYARPIPTPVAQLRPARETCQQCHWADQPHGVVLQTRIAYATDRDSTPRYTTLGLKVGPGDGGPGWIHWHASDVARIRYASVGEARREVLWVESAQPDGSIRRFENRRVLTSPEPDASDTSAGPADVRQMDCVDCHNRVAHVFRSPDDELDRLLANGQLSRALPFAKREGLRSVSRRFESAGQAMQEIAAGFRNHYQRNAPDVALEQSDAIDRAVDALREVWSRNVHPGMQVAWDTYPNHMGHPGPDRGCFRCHDRDLVDERGVAIGYDCTLCHSILAEESRSPFAFITGDVDSADAARAEWHRREYLEQGLLPDMAGDTPTAGSTAAAKADSGWGRE